MIHFITREDLLQWLERNCTRKAVVRALQEGLVEHLGAFTKLGPGGNPGWIVQVTSAISPVRAWDVEVVAEGKRYGIFIWDLYYRVAIDTPWEYWDGKGYPEYRAVNSLWDGDDPEKYARLRDERRTEIAKENRASENAKPESESENKETENNG